MIYTGYNNPDEEQEWENPKDPEQPSDARDREQVERQYEEAKRRKENLTETDHIDKEKKQSNKYLTLKLTNDEN